MILITSGAYLQSDFSSEIGLLPPSFLPIGNKRLYHHQVKFLKTFFSSKEEIFLSLPASYEVSQIDKRMLQDFSVEIIYTPDDLTLGEAVLYAWNSVAKQNNTLNILHGDTLFEEMSSQGLSNCFVSVHKNKGLYQRAIWNKDSANAIASDWSEDDDQVLSGLFGFNYPLLFMKSLVESKNNFVSALLNYKNSTPLRVISDGCWLDFGHINTFYDSRTKMTTQRAFNELNINSREVTKRSTENPKKIYAEGAWFLNIPLSLRLYTPALLALDAGGEEFENASYKIEYLYFLPLSDHFVFNPLPLARWEVIFKSLSSALCDFKSSTKMTEIDSSVLDASNDVYFKKTMSRLDAFSKDSSFDLHKKISQRADKENFPAISIVQLVDRAVSFIGVTDNSDLSVVHGDLCFSNILFDSRSESLKFIDPRGMSPSGQVTIFGDQRYDYAKLYHSVIGLYDFIIAGHYSLSIDETDSLIEYDLKFPRKQEADNEYWLLFRQYVVDTSPYSEKEILAITILLFLSMLPLHSDRPDRQQAFIANALRLYRMLESYS